MCALHATAQQFATGLSTYVLHAWTVWHCPLAVTGNRKPGWRGETVWDNHDYHDYQCPLSPIAGKVSLLLHSLLVSALTLWNSLPHSVRFWESLGLQLSGNTFKNFMFNRHSPPFPWRPTTPTPQIHFLALRKFIYLLTYFAGRLGWVSDWVTSSSTRQIRFLHITYRINYLVSTTVVVSTKFFFYFCNMRLQKGVL